MCFPAALPIASAAISAASTGLQFVGARQQAKQQAAFQAQAAAAERQRFQQEQTSLRMRQAQEQEATARELEQVSSCLLYTSPSPRDQRGSRMPSSA